MTLLCQLCLILIKSYMLEGESPEPYPSFNVISKFLSELDRNPRGPTGPVRYDSGIHPLVSNNKYKLRKAEVKGNYEPFFISLQCKVNNKVYCLTFTAARKKEKKNND